MLLTVMGRCWAPGWGLGKHWSASLAERSSWGCCCVRVMLGRPGQPWQRMQSQEAAEGGEKQAGAP